MYLVKGIYGICERERLPIAIKVNLFNHGFGYLSSRAPTLLEEWVRVGQLTQELEQAELGWLGADWPGLEEPEGHLPSAGEMRAPRPSPGLDG